MENINFLQITLIILYGFWINYEKNSTMFGTYQPVTCGLVVGLILGDIETGLKVGGTLQLMSLGISNFGGASVPDYQTASIVATYITIMTHQKPEIGITIGIPVALFMVQLDILRNTLGVLLVNKAEVYAKLRQYKKIEFLQYIGIILTISTTGIPVLIAVIFGPDLINRLLTITPDWFMNGLSIAGGLLPAVGIGLLLRYLPVKKYLSYLLIGFVLSVYLKVPMLGIAIIGIALALILYKNSNEKQQIINNYEIVGGNEDE